MTLDTCVDDAIAERDRQVRPKAARAELLAERAARP